MKPGLAIAALALIAGAGVIVWHGRAEWRSAKAKRAQLYTPVKAAAAPPVVAAPKPEVPQAVKYADIANKNLFSKDRNPNVIVPPPKPEEVKKMPPLPVVFGVLGLPSGVRAIMSVKSGEPSHPVRQGDTVGEFKIIALDIRNVTFDWDGQKISKPIDDLIDRSASAPVAANIQPAAPANPAPQPSMGLTPQQPASSSVSNPKFGKELGTAESSVRSCVPGETSPSGTVLDGYRKQIVPGPFGAGSQCSWIPVK